MTRGGKRSGAGRPKGSNVWGESTKALRVPESRVSDVMAFLEGQSVMAIPLYACKIQAGFPSPADDYIEAHLDLNTHLIKHPSSTFFVTATGDSMTGAGIETGDLLIVDRSVEATHGKIVIAALDGELTVKRLWRENQKIRLLPANTRYPAIEITDERNLVIWGVVIHVIHEAR
jgi:DNA polymerase V